MKSYSCLDSLTFKETETLDNINYFLKLPKGESQWCRIIKNLVVSAIKSSRVINFIRKTFNLWRIIDAGKTLSQRVFPADFFLIENKFKFHDLKTAHLSFIDFNFYASWRFAIKKKREKRKKEIPHALFLFT